MSGETFDLVALIRAVLIGLGCGLIVSAIGIFINARRQTKRPIYGWIMLGGGVALILIVCLFLLWPSLIVTPDLSGLAQAEAELKLEKKGLIPDAKPQYHPETEAGRVIPRSQEPLPGIKVQPGTVVRFAVSQGKSLKPAVEGEIASQVFVSLFRPKSGNKVHCTRYPDRIYRFSVEGTSTRLSAELRLLLWVRPVNPSSETPGWYLQRPPANGISGIQPDGSWKGVAQIGNVQWPPREGDVIDIAISVTDSETANQLMAETGVVVKDEPMGIKSDVALGVVVTLKWGSQ